MLVTLGTALLGCGSPKPHGQPPQIDHSREHEVIAPQAPPVGSEQPDAGTPVDAPIPMMAPQTPPLDKPKKIAPQTYKTKPTDVPPTAEPPQVHPDGSRPAPQAPQIPAPPEPKPPQVRPPPNQPSKMSTKPILVDPFE